MQTLESILLEILGELKITNQQQAENNRLMQAAINGDKPKRPKKDTPAPATTASDITGIKEYLELAEKPADPNTDHATHVAINLEAAAKALEEQVTEPAAAPTETPAPEAEEDPEAPISTERQTILRNHFRDIQAATLPADLAAMKARFEALKVKYHIAKIPEVKNKDYDTFERDLLAITEA